MLRFIHTFSTGMKYGLRFGGVVLAMLAFWMIDDSMRATANAYALACTAFIWSDFFRKISEDTASASERGGEGGE